MIHCTSTPWDTDPDISDVTWMGGGDTCELCGVDISDGHQYCQMCNNRLLTEKRRETPESRTRRIMRLVFRALSPSASEEEKQRCLAERVFVYSEEKAERLLANYAVYERTNGNGT